MVLERPRKLAIAGKVTHVRQRQHRFPPKGMQRLFEDGEQEFTGGRTVASTERQHGLGRKRKILRVRCLTKQKFHAALLVEPAKRSDDFEAGRSPHRTVERRNQHSTRIGVAAIREPLDCPFLFRFVGNGFEAFEKRERFAIDASVRRSIHGRHAGV